VSDGSGAPTERPQNDPFASGSDRGSRGRCEWRAEARRDESSGEGEQEPQHRALRQQQNFAKFKTFDDIDAKFTIFSQF
jgi:hypothetical protein